jgi:hypothetical protein
MLPIERGLTLRIGLGQDLALSGDVFFARFCLKTPDTGALPYRDEFVKDTPRS